MADIFGVRVTADLEILDSLIVICNDPGGQTEPAVTFAGQDYFVAWFDQAFSTRGSPVKVVRVDTQEVVLDTGVVIGNGDYKPDIAFDGTRCLVTWSEEFNGVVGRFVNTSGQPEGPFIEIALTQGNSTTPSTDFGANHYLVVWPDFCISGTDLDIFGQLVSTSGELIGERIQLAQGPASQSQPALAFDGNTFLVVWVEDFNTICGRYVSTNGIPIGDAFQISGSTSFERQHPSIAAGYNNYLVAWNEYHADFDVYGNLDISVGITETDDGLPARGLIMNSDRLARYFAEEDRLYDIQGRRVDNGRITPGIYFLERDAILVKIVVVR